MLLGFWSPQRTPRVYIRVGPLRRLCLPSLLRYVLLFKPPPPPIVALLLEGKSYLIFPLVCLGKMEGRK